MTLRCIGSATALGDVVTNPYTRGSPGIGLGFVPRTPLTVVQMRRQKGQGSGVKRAVCAGTDRVRPS